MESLQDNFTYSTDKLNQVLEEIWHQHQVINQHLEAPVLQGKETVVDCVLKLLSLSEELSSALRQKLNYTTETLQSTSHLLNALQDKQLVPNEVPADYYARISEVLGNAAAQLGVVENRLHEISLTFQETYSQTENAILVQDYNNDKHIEKEKGKTVTVPLPENHLLQRKTSISGQQEKSIAITPQIQNESTNIKQTLEQDSSTHLNGSRPSQREQEESKLLLEHTESDDSKLSESQSAQQEDKSRKNQSNGGNPVGDNSLQKTSKGNAAYDDPDKTTISSSGLVCNTTPVILPKERSKQIENHCSKKEFFAQEDGEDESKVACYITAPSITLQNVTCRILNDMSSLVISDSEELVSNVISVERLDPATKIPFPISIAIPFSARYRGSYRDIMVKVYDDKFQSSYLTPISLEGNHGNHKGSFAEVKVYKFGIFAVVSCLKKETFTVPRKGLPLKPSMDSRISLNYPPGSFTSSVIVQLKVQPIDASLISAMKVKHDVFHSLVSTSPLVYIQHPSSQPFLKPVNIFLPCPPNPEKKRQGEEAEHRRAASASVQKVTAALESRAVSASVRKHGDHISEHLKLLGFRGKEEQWIVLEDTVVKNVQNGLVSFEIEEHLDSFIVLRLSSAMDSGNLIQFIQMLEEATHNTMVNVVLYRKRENVHKAVVQVVPTKELNLEILSLREEGYSGPPEPSEKIVLREGEQIMFNFRGNIFASGKGDGLVKPYKLTFHSQRKQRLELELKVVDEFGNYCSPHYKGTAVFYKLTKEDIAKSYTHPILPEDYEQMLTPICKLPLTLPKYEKIISRPPSTKRISTDSSDVLWDKLLYWLSEELSEEDTAMLVLSLPIRRSTVQLIKLKSPDNLTDQIYELLNYWKKHLPTSADKLRLLCRHLRKSGRSDLSEELKSMWENKVFPRQPHHRFGASYSNE